MNVEKRMISFWGKYFSANKSKKIDYTLIFELLKENELISKDLRCLDFGFGNSHFIHELKKYYTEIYGCDVIDSVVDNFILKNDDRNIKVRCNTYNNIPFEESFFDIIFAVKSMSAISDMNLLYKSIVEIDRILKKRGYFFVIDFAYNVTDLSKYNLNILKGETIHSIMPKWSTVPFIHFTIDNLQNLLEYDIVTSQYINLLSCNGKEQDGFVLVLYKS